MAATITRPVLSRLRIPQRKTTNFIEAPLQPGGYLSPDLQPNTPPTFPNDIQQPVVSRIGQYLLLEQLESAVNVIVYKAIHCVTEQIYTCKVNKLKLMNILCSMVNIYQSSFA